MKADHCASISDSYRGESTLKSLARESQSLYTKAILNTKGPPCLHAVSRLNQTLNVYKTPSGHFYTIGNNKTLKRETWQRPRNIANMIGEWNEIERREQQERCIVGISF